MVSERRIQGAQAFRVRREVPLQTMRMSVRSEAAAQTCRAAKQGGTTRFYPVLTFGKDGFFFCTEGNT